MELLHAIVSGGLMLAFSGFVLVLALERDRLAPPRRRAVIRELRPVRWPKSA
ncbi:MAG: hypothetical protein ACREQJ_15065 [Candidatus Binatia bacterium]